jgi:hypothetical protein
MEFNTLSIWGIIIFLILVTIFIVIWYSYKEIIYCKRKIEDMSGQTEYIDEDMFFQQMDELDDVCNEDIAYEENEDIAYEENDDIQEENTCLLEEIEEDPDPQVEQPIETPELFEPLPVKKKTRKSKKLVIEEL